MSDLTRRNRLDEAQSPYLRQHADNPVDWQPWDETALSAARERDDPIFLSVGYSACHWCHVMEGESFADEAVAAVLNDGFVPIKVDREERPDVDTIYMTICQLVTGRGGWPLSVWLTPDGRPFYVGTYFPKEPKRGQPGFLDVLERLREAWKDDREAIEARADEWTAALEDRLSGTGPSRPTPADGTTDTGKENRYLTAAADAAMRGADREHGGFGTAGPKFPQPVRIDALFRVYDRTGKVRYLDVAVEALDAMISGGLYDHVGGGFHRYCVDREWTVPHFEKMLYDNAALVRVLLAGYQLTGDDRYADVVRETLSFLNRELSHEAGGVFSTLDAQSLDDRGEREEGAFYVWTPETVAEAIDDPDLAALACDRFGVTEAGTFEGATVLTIDTAVEDLASAYDLDAETVESRLETATDRLFETRESRPRPNRDEKVLAGWNGLAIAAAAEAAFVLEDVDATLAVDALAFVKSHLWDPDERRLFRRYKDGDVAIHGYLDDYAFLARGSFRCYELTGAVEHLAFALDLGRTICEEFWDADAETLYFTPKSGDSLVTRPQEHTDGAIPSPTGVTLETLAALSGFGESAFDEVVECVLDTLEPKMRSNPTEHVSLSLAADRHEHGSLEVVLAAESVPESWWLRLRNRYLPDRVLAPRPPTESALEDWLSPLGLDDAPPIWAGRTARDGEATLYVCRDRTCSPPLDNVDEAFEWIDESRLAVDGDESRPDGGVDEDGNSAPF